MPSFWDNVKSELKATVPEHTYRMWLEPLGLKVDRDVYTICCPNFFSKRKVQQDYQNLIVGALESCKASKIQHLEFVVERTAKKDLPAEPAISAKTPEPAKPLTAAPHRQIGIPLDNQFTAGTFLKRNFTFDQFVVGNNNNFAYSAALALASSKSFAQPSLYLSANTGLGKSHLVQAVGHEVLGSNPYNQVYYISAGDFSAEMVSAMKNDRMEAFKTKYRRSCDVLLLDDVHHLSGKDYTQKELVSILDYLFEAGKKIIFSSYYAPGDIPKLNDKLRSRLGSGLISAIEQPDFKTRLKILQKKSEAHNYVVPRDILEYLAESLADDVRQLESGLHCVMAKAELIHVPLELTLAEDVVRSMVRSCNKITIETIKNLICQYYKVSNEDLVSKSRRSNIVHPRQMAMFLARRYTDCPLQVIGRAFNRYHATAIHAINSLEKSLKTNGEVKNQLGILESRLEHMRH